MRGAAAATKVVGSTGPIHSSLATSFGHPQADGYGLDFMTAMAVSDLGSQDFSGSSELAEKSSPEPEIVE